MKTLLLVLGLTILIGGFNRSHAQIIPVSVHSELSVSGWAIVPPEFGGESEAYSITHTSDGLYPLSDSISGTATAHLTILPPFEIYLGTLLEATSYATQSITISSNQIEISTDIDAFASIYSQVGMRGSLARSILRIGFSISEPVLYTLSGYIGFFPGDGINNPAQMSTMLSSTSGAQLFSCDRGETGISIVLDWPEPISGYMAPGSYVLQTEMIGPGGVCPLGHGTSGTQSFMLSVIPATVADQLPTGLLLALSTVVLGTMRRWSAITREI